VDEHLSEQLIVVFGEFRLSRKWDNLEQKSKNMKNPENFPVFGTSHYAQKKNQLFNCAETCSELQKQ
jgi:hypothetical protein